MVIIVCRNGMTSRASLLNSTPLQKFTALAFNQDFSPQKVVSKPRYGGLFGYRSPFNKNQERVDVDRPQSLMLMEVAIHCPSKRHLGVWL